MGAQAPCRGQGAGRASAGERPVPLPLSWPRTQHTSPALGACSSRTAAARTHAPPSASCSFSARTHPRGKVLWAAESLSPAQLRAPLPRAPPVRRTSLAASCWSWPPSRARTWTAAPTATPLPSACRPWWSAATTSPLRRVRAARGVGCKEFPGPQGRDWVSRCRAAHTARGDGSRVVAEQLTMCHVPACSRPQALGWCTRRLGTAPRTTRWASAWACRCSAPWTTRGASPTRPANGSRASKCW